MSTIRRSVIRPAAPPAPSRRLRAPQALRLQNRIEEARAAMSRWMKRLKRAFHAVDKAQQRITRYERQLAQTEE